MANYGRPDNKIDNEEAAFRLRLNRDIGAVLDQPEFRSRRIELMSQVRIEQAQRRRRVQAIPQRGFNPFWARAIAAVFVLLVVAALLTVTLRSNDNARNAPVAAVVPAPTFLAAAIPTSGTSAEAQGSTNQSTHDSAAKAGVAPAPVMTTTVAAAPAMTTTVAAAAPARATAAPVAAAAPASGVSALSTPAAKATIAGSTSATINPVAPTMLLNTPLPAGTLARTPPGGLPAYPGTLPLSLPTATLQNFLATLTANLSDSQRQGAGLQGQKTFNFSPQFSTGTKGSKVTSEQVIAYYQKEGQKAGYKVGLTPLRNDPKLNANWLLLEKSGGRVGILVLEFKETTAPDALFGAGKLGIGETALFFTQVQ